MARLEDLEGVAVDAGCAVFLTNDAAIRHPAPGLDIWMLRDIVD